MGASLFPEEMNEGIADIAAMTARRAALERLDSGEVATFERGAEWQWRDLPEHPARELTNVVIEVTVSGTAGAAGLSFGHFKDFLVPVSAGRTRRLQLEIDAATNMHAFRADGRIVAPRWWSSAVKSVADLHAGTLQVKAQNAAGVTFTDLRVHELASSPRISVLLTCYRFARRLRLALESWCRQRVPAGALEIIVANPTSPDATHAVIAEAAAKHPDVRIRELPVEARWRTNKGHLINRAFEMSHAEWIWLTDADILFPPAAAATVLRHAARHKLLYCTRLHLLPAVVEKLLERQTVASIEALHGSTGQVDKQPWGYCQILHRGVLKALPYPDYLDRYNDSDEMFRSRCTSAGLTCEPLEDLSCFHLSHPFAWNGTDADL